MYIERLNNCTATSCNATDQQDTYSAIAEICAVFSIPITIGPEATALTSTSNPLFSTVAIPSQSSLPPVITTITSGATSITMSASENVPVSTSHASTSTVSMNSSGSSGGSSTSVQSSTSSFAGATAASSTPTDNESSHFSSPSRMALILGVGLTSIIHLILV
ncbi:uncharacterized protein Z518_01700 [Rhinocladiella mackenziei CBS 650.93]|uniref:Rhinocladiella mackenziei CBS 650.93 unplaced genomic scaffold supercont1.1, whole genome shotgun sequence n=1 Tax=Rhinocladiella mackenziei CBS 650.93 TaxID=1442369 RepID=A0A0D2J4I8_9EURO|nr:uncharacterized protein Z518_01700 [Rhinocladiella mackenziei CBS 650.93]KIX10616.1 hypothetical protein Z518_01700 [Rhinocladiella mackenziei CBS 650.93]